MTLDFSAYVEGDFDEISESLALYSPASADRTLNHLRTELIRVAESPLQFARRPDIDTSARAAVVGRYLILFTTSRQHVRIERVVHGSRFLPSLFHEALQNG